MEKYVFLVVPLSLMLSAVLVGCSDKSEPNSTETNYSPKVVPVIAKPGSVNYVIDFSQTPFPDFVADARGISGAEPWGRWSDGEKISFTFNKPLPHAFELTLTVHAAYGSNANAPVRVIVGNVERTFSVTKPDETFVLDFELEKDASSLEIIPSHPASPKSLNLGEDARVLGLALSKLSIDTK